LRQQGSADSGLTFNGHCHQAAENSTRKYICVVTSGLKNIDNVDNPRQDSLPPSEETPKIVFRPVKMKNTKLPRSSSLEVGEENLPAEYLEIVNFVNSGWSSVKVELEQGERQAVERT